MAKITPEHYQSLQRQKRMLLDQAFNNIEWGNETSPPATPPDLEVVAKARDIDSVHDGKELLTNGFAETLFFEGLHSSERPSPYKNAMEGSIPREPGTYDLNVVNASVTIDGVEHRNRNITIELANPAVVLNGWHHNVDSSIKLMRPGATGKFGQTFESGSILRDARFSGTSNSLRTESTDFAFEQESSNIWGGSYALLFEIAAKFDCDVWLTIAHLMCDPNRINMFFFRELRKQITAFPNKVYVQYSTDLHGDNNQSDWIMDRADDVYSDDDDAYDTMVGRLAGTCAGQINHAGVEHVLPLGFSGAMLEEFEKSSGGLVPDYWCRQSQDDNDDDRTWELLK